MASQKDLDSTYMGVALLHAKLSKAERKKVGACLVTAHGVIIPGVNGLPKPFGNQCEYLDNSQLVTKREVIHAEQACLNKCAKEGVSSIGSMLYVTHACCEHCASNLVACGITEVVYMEEYKSQDGLELLKLGGVKVRKYEYEEFDLEE